MCNVCIDLSASLFLSISRSGPSGSLLPPENPWLNIWRASARSCDGIPKRRTNDPGIGKGTVHYGIPPGNQKTSAMNPTSLSTNPRNRYRCCCSLSLIWNFPSTNFWLGNSWTKMSDRSSNARIRYEDKDDSRDTGYKQDTIIVDILDKLRDNLLFDKARLSSYKASRRGVDDMALKICAYRNLRQTCLSDISSQSLRKYLRNPFDDISRPPFPVVS